MHYDNSIILQMLARVTAEQYPENEFGIKSKCWTLASLPPSHMLPRSFQSAISIFIIASERHGFACKTKDTTSLGIEDAKLLRERKVSWSSGQHASKTFAWALHN